MIPKSLSYPIVLGMFASALQSSPLLDPQQTAETEIGIADFNGDQLPDLALRYFNTGNVQVYLNQGNTFSENADWIGVGRSAPTGVTWDTLYADFDGDGLADVIDRARSSGNMCVHRNLGTDFSASAPCYSGFGRPSPQWKTHFGLMDADQREDLISVDQNTGTVYVHRNNGAGFDASPFITQQVAVHSNPANGWEQLVADCTNDGLDDLINLHQPSNTFFCHKNQGSSFQSTTGRIFRGSIHVYEHQSHMADFNLDGVADVLSHNLRTGEMLALPVYPHNSGNDLASGSRGLLAYQTVSYSRSNSQQPIPEHSSRSLNALAWYDIDHNQNNARPIKATGWHHLYPGYPEASTGIFNKVYRSDTPLLGTYLSSDPKVLRQHAYWLAASGSNAVVIGWSNCPQDDPATSGENGSIEDYCDKIRAATRSLIEEFDSIRDFSTPKVVIAIDIKDPTRDRTKMANDVASAFAGMERHALTYDDGSVDRNLPVLMVFVNVNNSADTSWSDPRFNIRFTQGYLRNHGVTTVESPACARVSSSIPLWAFVENEPHPSLAGHYRHVYRPMPTHPLQSEQSILWTSIHQQSGLWDGQQDSIGGLIPTERTAAFHYSKPARNIVVGRFNYPLSWLAQPQEGVSADGSSYFEPSDHPGFTVFNAVADALFDLRALTKNPPDAPVITYRSTITNEVVFDSGGLPTEFCISTTVNCTNWQIVDVGDECPLYFYSSPSFHIKTRNAFGESPSTYFNAAGVFGAKRPACQP